MAFRLSPNAGEYIPSSFKALTSVTPVVSNIGTVSEEEMPALLNGTAEDSLATKAPILNLNSETSPMDVDSTMCSRIVRPKKSKDQRAGPRRNRKHVRKTVNFDIDGENSLMLSTIRDDDYDLDADLDDLLLSELPPNVDNVSEKSETKSEKTTTSQLSSHSNPKQQKSTSHNNAKGYTTDRSATTVEPLDDLVPSDWLVMQEEWYSAKISASQSKNGDNNFGVGERELLLERLEREKWGLWAIKAAEIERVRRIEALEAIDREQDRERKARMQWAVDAIERERNERISNQFLSTLTATNWFNETISAYSEDYTLVCPYYKLGCREACSRKTVAMHLQECDFAIECKPQNPFSTNSSQLNSAEVMDYEVVCTNAILGCTYIGGRNEIYEHLKVCSFKGMTLEEEQEERSLLRRTVILASEEERVRRVFLHELKLGLQGAYLQQNGISSSPFNGAGKDSKRAWLHRLLRTQINSISQQLHTQIDHYAQTVKSIQQSRQSFHDEILSNIRGFVSTLWPYSRVEVYGSYATGLHSSSSDIDLVVCFSDDYQSLLSVRGTIPLLHILADYLRCNVNASAVLDIYSLILHSRVPVIKAATSSAFNRGMLGVAIDISIDCAAHSGLATTEMVRTMLQALPPLEPLVFVIKEYLRSQDLFDAYRGGLSSYAVVLLAIIPIIKRLRQTSTAPPVTVSLSATTSSGSLVNLGKNVNAATEAELVADQTKEDSIDVVVREIDTTNDKSIVVTTDVINPLDEIEAILSNTISSYYSDNSTAEDSHKLLSMITGAIERYAAVAESETHNGVQLSPPPSIIQKDDYPQSLLGDQQNPSQTYFPFPMNSGGATFTSTGSSKSSNNSPGSSAAARHLKLAGRGLQIRNTGSPQTTPDEKKNSNCSPEKGSSPPNDTVPSHMPDASFKSYGGGNGSFSMIGGGSPRVGGIGSNRSSRQTTPNNNFHKSPSSSMLVKQGQGQGQGYVAASLSNSKRGLSQPTSRGFFRQFNTWSSIASQRDYGRKIAIKLLQNATASANCGNSMIHVTASSSSTFDTVTASATIGGNIMSLCPTPTRPRSQTVTGIYNSPKPATTPPIMSADGSSFISSNNHQPSTTSKPTYTSRSLTPDLLSPGIYSNNNNSSYIKEGAIFHMGCASPILGELLEEFLSEFGDEWLIGKHGYSVRDGGFRFDLISQDSSCPAHPQAADPLVIEDPVNVVNNVARTCYRASLVREAFSKAHERLKNITVRQRTTGAGGSNQNTSLHIASTSNVSAATATAKRKVQRDNTPSSSLYILNDVFGLTCAIGEP